MLKKIKENKILKILWGVVKTLLTGFLVLLVLIIAIQRFTNNNFAIAGIRVFTVITESMYPEYKVGDMIIAVETKPENIEIGDNVVYNGLEGDFKGKIVTHKVIEKEQKENGYTFITKGVNNTIEDPEIKDNQIIGKVIYKTFILSSISRLINNTTTFFIVLFIPFALLVFFEILDVVEERKKEEEE